MWHTSAHGVYGGSDDGERCQRWRLETGNNILQFARGYTTRITESKKQIFGFGSVMQGGIRAEPRPCITNSERDHVKIFSEINFLSRLAETIKQGDHVMIVNWKDGFCPDFGLADGEIDVD
jgi:hypothetical protein